MAADRTLRIVQDLIDAADRDLVTYRWADMADPKQVGALLARFGS